MFKKPEEIAQKAANILKDEKVASAVRSSAAEALSNFGQAAAQYIPDIANILKDEKVNSIVRSSAAEALSNFGQAAAQYIPDIANILKDEKVNSTPRVYLPQNSLNNMRLTLDVRSLSYWFTSRWMDT